MSNLFILLARAFHVGEADQGGRTIRLACRSISRCFSQGKNNAKMAQIVFLRSRHRLGIHPNTPYWTLLTLINEWRSPEYLLIVLGTKLKMSHILQANKNEQDMGTDIAY